jgi:hypothetical protein
MALPLPSRRFLLTTVAAVAIFGFGVAAASFAQGYGQHRWHGDRGPMGGPRHAQAMGALMGEADTDKDGTISRTEAEAFAGQRAKAIDANNDGKITAAEIQAYREKRRQERMAEWLKRLDADGDGTVSVAEFEKAQVWRMARLDRDGDGRIEQRERMHRGMMGHGHGMGRDMGGGMGGPAMGPR